MTQIFIIPRWGGSPDMDWYPWIEHLFHGDEAVSIHTLNMPDWDDPSPDSSLEAILKVLAPAELEGDVLLVGHSVGCLSWINYLDYLVKSGHEFPFMGLVAVAGWFNLQEPWPEAMPWINLQPDFEAIKAICPEVCLVQSDNDPYTPASTTNRQAWQERLNARERLYPGAQHLNGSQERGVLEAIQLFL